MNEKQMLDQIALSLRARLALVRAGITTLEQLAERVASDPTLSGVPDSHTPAIPGLHTRQEILGAFYRAK